MPARPRRFSAASFAHSGFPVQEKEPGAVDPRQRVGGIGSLPCLNRNNSTEPPPELPPDLAEKWNKLAGQHRKTAWLLRESVLHLAKRYGIQRIAFLTLTFADHVTCAREGQKRLNSLMTHVLRVRYPDFIRVLERHASGRIHYHLLVVLQVGLDIRTGVDFAAFKRGDYRSAGAFLRSEWAFWRETAKRYRFGRTELLPVKSTAEGVAHYVGKYVAKHIGQRQEADKGVRLVSFTKGAKVGTSRFGWISPGAWVWRAKVALFASCLGAESLDDLTTGLGPRWTYRYQDLICSMPVQEYPTVEHLEADIDRSTGERYRWPAFEPRDVQQIRLGDPGQRLIESKRGLARLRAAFKWNLAKKENK